MNYNLATRLEYGVDNVGNLSMEELEKRHIYDTWDENGRNELSKGDKAIEIGK